MSMSGWYMVKCYGRSGFLGFRLLEKPFNFIISLKNFILKSKISLTKTLIIIFILLIIIQRCGTFSGDTHAIILNRPWLKIWHHSLEIWVKLISLPKSRTRVLYKGVSDSFSNPETPLLPLIPMFPAQILFADVNKHPLMKNATLLYNLTPSTTTVGKGDHQTSYCSDDSVRPCHDRLPGTRQFAAVCPLIPISSLWGSVPVPSAPGASGSEHLLFRGQFIPYCAVSEKSTVANIHMNNGLIIRLSQLPPPVEKILLRYTCHLVYRLKLTKSFSYPIRILRQASFCH